MRNKLFNVKADDEEVTTIKKLLADIKKINRYKYPEIIIMALKSFKAGLRKEVY